MKNKIIPLTLAAVLAATTLASCDSAENAKEEQATAKPTEAATQTTADVDKSDAIHIRIVLENGKEMKADLYPHVAPLSVENFVKLVNEHFYDGLIFHRVISGFMVQAGGYDSTFYDGNFNDKETESIKGEFSANGVENNLKHTRGILSMARTQVKDSASSQFFIMHEDSPSLDGQYAAFGEITEGLDVVDEIASTETTSMEGSVTYQGTEYTGQVMGDVPKSPIVIKTIEVIE